MFPKHIFLNEQERIHTGLARKLWFPYGIFENELVLFGRALRWPPPRLLQLLQLWLCRQTGHRWSEWVIDDYEGPRDGLMPLCSRPARPEEFGTRVCQRGCGTVQRRKELS